MSEGWKIHTASPTCFGPTTLRNQRPVKPAVMVAPVAPRCRTDRRGLWVAGRPALVVHQDLTVEQSTVLAERANDHSGLDP